MNAITRLTRKMSFDDIKSKRPTRHKIILEVLGNRSLTANEVAQELFDMKVTPHFDRNFAHPRLNELVKAKIVTIPRKRKCAVSGKICAVYEVCHE